MALDPNILLQARAPDLLSAVSGGVQLGQNIRMQPLREALARQQLATQQAQQQALLNRQQAVPAQLQVFNKLVELSQHPDPRISNPAKIELGTLARAGTITGQERIAQSPDVTQQVAQSQAQITGAGEAAKLAEREAVQPRIAQKETEAKETAKLAATSIAEGLDAAKGIPVLKRSIGLLDSVKTGGFANAAFRAKQAFGFESADEGELSANLGQAILGDLRATFGAAFTEKEGERLERIRARFGANADTNRRLLNQSLQIAEQAAKRAQDRAVAKEDFATAQEIKDLMSFEFQMEQPAQKTPSFEGFEILNIRPE